MLYNLLMGMMVASTAMSSARPFSYLSTDKAAGASDAERLVGYGGNTCCVCTSGEAEENEEMGLSAAGDDATDVQCWVDYSWRLSSGDLNVQCATACKGFHRKAAGSSTTTGDVFNYDSKAVTSPKNAPDRCSQDGHTGKEAYPGCTYLEDSKNAAEEAVQAAKSEAALWKEAKKAAAAAMAAAETLSTEKEAFQKLITAELEKATTATELGKTEWEKEVESMTELETASLADHDAQAEYSAKPALWRFDSKSTEASNNKEREGSARGRRDHSSSEGAVAMKEQTGQADTELGEALKEISDALKEEAGLKVAKQDLLAKAAALEKAKVKAQAASSLSVEKYKEAATKAAIAEDKIQRAIKRRPPASASHSAAPEATVAQRAAGGKTDGIGRCASFSDTEKKEDCCSHKCDWGCTFHKDGFLTTCLSTENNEENADGDECPPTTCPEVQPL